MKFFGERWDAPAFEDAVEVPVPFGAACLFCPDLIDEDDSGILTPYLGADGQVGEAAAHLECHLRSVLGSVQHLERRCTCFGGEAHDGFGRDEARRVIAWLRAHPAGAAGPVQQPDEDGPATGSRQA